MTGLAGNENGGLTSCEEPIFAMEDGLSGLTLGKAGN